MANVKIGCCGFALPQAKYFEFFRLIEVQITFYQLPRLKTAEKWRDLAPDDFEFTMKAWQLITHESSSPTYRRLGKKIEPSKHKYYGGFQDTDEVLEAWEHTAYFARTLGASTILFQCPAAFRPKKENIANMRKFFEGIDRGDLRFTWEPRGNWPGDLVKGLCEELDLIHCVDPFKNQPIYGDFQYFRLFGKTRKSLQYTDQELQQIKDWTTKKPTYVLFSNDWMAEDAMRFILLVGAR